MRSFFTAIIIIVAASVAASGQEPVSVIKSDITEKIDGTTYYLHFVKEGETIYSLARAYGVDVSTVFIHNASAQDGIKPGQLIKIPQISAAESIGDKIQAADSANFHYHIVQQGETLFGLSKKYSISIGKIKELNPRLEEYPKTGQLLRIPKNLSGKQEVAEGYIIHEVSKGETLFSLAKKYDVTIGQIKNANPEIAEAIKTGQSLYIPATKKEIPEEEVEAVKDSDDGFIKHTVTSGETLYAIAHKYAVEIDTLKHYNPGLSEIINQGQMIRIPVSDEQRTFIVHHSYTKEKLESIAGKYGLEAGQIEEMNPGVSKRIKSGENIKIPVNPVEKQAPDTTGKEMVKREDLEEKPCSRRHSEANRTFNVALMIPFFLENYDSVMMSEPDFFDLRDMRSFRFIQFYEGFLLAADSMRKKGMDINLFVYDVDNDARKTRRTLESSELSSMDLIIGPFYSASFTEAQKFAKTFNITIVNPLSPRNDIVKSNPSVFKMMPAEKSQAEIISSFVLKKFIGSNIILVRQNKYQHAAESQSIIEEINQGRARGIYYGNRWMMNNIPAIRNQSQVYSENKLIRQSSLKEHPGDSLYFSNSVKEINYTSDSLPNLRLSMSYLRHNVVIVISEDKVFAQEIMSRLNKMGLQKSITLIGYPEWEQFEGLETEYKLNLDFHTLSPALIDYQADGTKEFISKFRKMFGTEPVMEFYAYQGFDIGWYFLNALSRFGIRFEDCLNDFNPGLLHTRFYFRKSSDGGYENQYWNLVKFKDYEKVNAWKIF
ncbi:MAG: LysM peptidoglycan-binding domain-containing protein [Bacteroidales bacterium]|nr:LysM peptidoglycan-binding domain-containing protein [Bacteroidales bacterium]